MTKRDDKRKERDAAKDKRLKWRQEMAWREKMAKAKKQPETWTPVGKTGLEVNQFGRARIIQ